MKLLHSIGIFERTGSLWTGGIDLDALFELGTNADPYTASHTEVFKLLDWSVVTDDDDL